MNPTESGLAPVNGLDLYWESYGSGDTPLVVLHGGYGMTATMSEVVAAFATDRRVIAVDLQGHGLTADIDRPITYEALGDDIAALVTHLGLGPDVRRVMKQISRAQVLMDKLGALLAADYDWTAEVAAMTTRSMIIFADADSVPISHVADFYRLLGGGLRDAGWDGSARSANQLAILPDVTHYDVLSSPALVGLARAFLT